MRERERERERERGGGGERDLTLLIAYYSNIATSKTTRIPIFCKIIIV